MRAYVCDRCERVIDYDSEVHVVFYNSANQETHRFDLCKECEKEILKTFPYDNVLWDD